MYGEACKKAIEVYRTKKGVISWDPDTWVKGFSEVVKIAYQMNFEPDTLSRFDKTIRDLLGARRIGEKV